MKGWCEKNGQACNNTNMLRSRNSPVFFSIVGGTVEPHIYGCLQTMKIAVIEVISGLTHKRGKRVNSALYCPFSLVCIPFKSKEYLTADSTAMTAI